MAVAKSYEGMTIVGEPYERDKKMYVRVSGPCSRCGGSGNYSYNPMDGTRCFGCGGSGKQVKEVRWYTDSQRATMDKAAEKRAADRAVKVEERRIKFAAHNAFGFGEKNYIMLIYGKNDEIKAWRDTLPRHTIFYNEIFGWYIPSENTIDLVIPEEIKSVRLDWEKVRDQSDKENLTMIDNAEVKKIVDSLTSEPSKSEWQGKEGEWLPITEVTIIKNIMLDGYYGASHMHILQDKDENEYVWTTSSKNIEEGSTINLQMKVKEHKEYKGTKQTVVYYCKIK